VAAAWEVQERVVRDVLLRPGRHVVGGRQILEREEEAGIASVLPGQHLVGIGGRTSTGRSCVGSSPNNTGLALYSRGPARRWEAGGEPEQLCSVLCGFKGAARGRFHSTFPLAIRLVKRNCVRQPGQLVATPGVFALAAARCGVGLGLDCQTVAEGSA